MPLTTYTAGQVLTAASLNANLSFAASSPASGATLVVAQSFSAVASVSMAAGTFTSTYQNYLVMLQITATSTGQSISLRVNNAGTPRTGADYTGAKCTTRASDGAVEGVGSNSATSFNFTTVGTTSLGGYAFNVYSPQVATTRTSLSYTGMGLNPGASSGAAQSGGMQYATAEANDGLTFLVGGTITGNIRVYGLADS